jgi:hypothetical protein
MLLDENVSEDFASAVFKSALVSAKLVNVTIVIGLQSPASPHWLVFPSTFHWLPLPDRISLRDIVGRGGRRRGERLVCRRSPVRICDSGPLQYDPRDSFLQYLG